LFRQLARAAGHEVELLRGGALMPAQQERPALVLVGSVGPGGLTEARYLCRRLRARFPGVQVLVGRWGRRRAGREREALLAARAGRVAATLREAAAQLGRPRGSPETATAGVRG